MPLLPLHQLSPFQLGHAQADPYGREAIQVQRLPIGLHATKQLKTSHAEQAHGQETVCMPFVFERIQIQASAGEARGKAAHLGGSA